MSTEIVDDGAGGRRPFDPATGDWLPAPSTPPSQGLAPRSPPSPPSPASGDSPQPAPESRSRRPGARAWDVILGIDLAVLGIFYALTAIAALLDPGAAADEVAKMSDAALRSALWQELALLLTFLAVIPFAWSLGTRAKPWKGTVRFFRLERPLRSIAIGVAVGLGVLLASAILGRILLEVEQGTATDLTDNPVVERIAGVMTWPLALATAATAAVAEELFFRGLLQRKLGVWGQAAVFGIVHAAYGTVLQVVFPFALGVAFGYFVKRGWGLWSVIVAHFLYDLTALAATAGLLGRP